MQPEHSRVDSVILRPLPVLEKKLMQRQLTGVVLALAIGIPAAAQTVSKPVDKPEGPTEKIWILETSGLGG